MILIAGVTESCHGDRKLNSAGKQVAVGNRHFCLAGSVSVEDKRKFYYLWIGLCECM